MLYEKKTQKHTATDVYAQLRLLWAKCYLCLKGVEAEKYLPTDQSLLPLYPCHVPEGWSLKVREGLPCSPALEIGTGDTRAQRTSIGLFERVQSASSSFSRLDTAGSNT